MRVTLASAPAAAATGSTKVTKDGEKLRDPENDETCQAPMEELPLKSGVDTTRVRSDASPDKAGGGIDERLQYILERSSVRKAESDETCPVKTDSVPMEAGADTTPVVSGIRSNKAEDNIDETVQQDLSRPSTQEDVTFGFFLGCATGVSIRHIGRAILFCVGTEVIFLQLLARRRWVTIHWKRISRDMAPSFSRSAWEGLLDLLVYRMPFHAAFTGGFYLGLKLV